MPDLPAPHVPSPVILHCPDASLRLIFEWQHDRFMHRIVWQNESLKSVDGAADDAWPPSPPLQQLSLEDLHGRETVLGVGAAGQSHWSVSVQAIRTESPEDPASGITFDWACRAKDAPRFLGSTYLAGDAFEISPQVGSRFETLDDGRWRILPNAELAAGTLQWGYRIAPK